MGMPPNWPNQASAAVSLTFEGATARHLDVAQMLTDLGLCATFYAYPPNLLDDPRAWLRASRNGHELGNHALFGAVDDGGLLIRMSREAIEEEIEDGRMLLEAEFGVKAHSAAMPMVRTHHGESGFPTVSEVVRRTTVRINNDQLGPVLRARYDVIRSPLDHFNTVDTLSTEVGCFQAEGLDAVSVCLMLQVGISQGNWTVLSIGPDCDLPTLRQIAGWLTRQSVCVAPVVEVGRCLAGSNAPSPSLKQP